MADGLPAGRKHRDLVVSEGKRRIAAPGFLAHNTLGHVDSVAALPIRTSRNCRETER